MKGLGCVYLEAMSVGKPVIGCRGQGIAEIIQHGSNGFLVGPDNEKELALALAMLLRDEARRRNLGAAARDTILERLTLAQQAESLARIYRESRGMKRRLVILTEIISPYRIPLFNALAQRAEWICM